MGHEASIFAYADGNIIQLFREYANTFLITPFHPPILLNQSHGHLSKLASSRPAKRDKRHAKHFALCGGFLNTSEHKCTETSAG